MDCFVVEFIIGPAEGRTRWLLAMTMVLLFEKSKPRFVGWAKAHLRRAHHLMPDQRRS
jgi:hypothetical protein